LYWIGVNLEIEERKQAEFYLAEGERIARMGSWVLDPAGFFPYWSHELFHIYGLDPAKEGPSLEEYLAIIHPQDREFMRSLINRMFAEASGCDVTKRIVRPDGEVRYVRCVAVPIVENGTLKRILGSALDVTGHELLTQELRRREAYLMETQRLSHTGSFGWRPDTGEIVWSDETFRIFEYNPAEKPTASMVWQRTHPQDRALAQQVIDRASLTGADFEYECRLLMADGRVKHVHAIAHTVQNACGNREFIGAVTDITERKTTEDKIRRLVDADILGIFIANVEGEIVEANQAFLRMLRYGRQDLVSGRLRWTDLTPAELRERDERALTEALATGVFLPYEKEFLRQDGSRLPVLIGGALFQSANEGVVFVLDLSEQKRAEEGLRQSEERFRLILESIGAQVITTTLEGELDFVNQPVLDYFGKTMEQLKGWRTTDVLHPDDLASAIAVWKDSIEKGLSYDVDHRFRRSDGVYRWFHVRGRPQRDVQGSIVRWYALLTDIEDRKTAEGKIREQEAALRQIVDLVPQIVAVFGPDGERLYANRIGLDYVGLSLEEWRKTPGNFLSSWSFFHPDDRERAARTYSDNARSGGSAYELELRLPKRDGSYRWFLVRFNPLRDEQGQITRWYIALTDIEDRKQAEDSLRHENVALKRAEEKIREQEAELRQMLNLTPQHVHVLTADARLVYTNEIALKYHGSVLHDWQLRPLIDWRIDELPITLLHPDDRERVMCELKSTLSSGSPHETEARLLRNDGKYLWFLFRYNPLRDEQGRVVRWYVAGTDIDDRKQAEERLKHENVVLREEIDMASMFEEIVGTSPPLQAVLSRVSKVARTDSTVLITGETGTGKELVARAIHRRSRRSSRAFVSVNCAAIPRDLIASELFGHEKGAFTGAVQRRLGRFESAGGGTIFLDEVGELPAETQIALLRVLQEHEFERVGGIRSIQTDIRVIAATNRDLQAAIAVGSFRSDLFYRLNVFPIEIPPLRDRREDIPMLVEYFIDRFARKASKSIRGLNKKTLDLLQSYAWPGNIRELQNVIERSVIVCESENFSVDESWLSRQPLAPEPKSPLDLSQKLATQEKEMIEAALRESEGRVFGPSGAAAKLGMPRSTLESKIRSLKINKNLFRS
jgi:formate hydrogenlyase transcriptional activator